MYPRPRAGNAAVYFVLTFMVLAGFAAFAVDLSIARVERAQLQQAADATALASAGRLNGTVLGLEGATTLGTEVAAANEVAGEPFPLDGSSARVNGTLEYGQWLNGAFVATDDLIYTNAVRVRGIGQTPTFFARLAYQINVLEPEAEAIAAGGGPSEAECVLPIAIPSEVFEGAACSGFNLTFGPDGSDNGAWARMGTSRPSSSFIRDAIHDCALNLGVTDTVTMNNGQVSSATQELGNALIASTDRWNTAEWGAQPARRAGSVLTAAQYGRVLIGPIVVVDMPASGQMNVVGAPVKGFATGAIYDVVASGSPANRRVSMRIICSDSDEPGGGGSFLTTSRPVLVQ